MSDNYPCEYCDSSAGLEDRVVTVYRHRGGQHFIFENVRASVCRNCGHRYFNWDVAQEMDTAMDSPDVQDFARPVPVIELSAHR
jgi:YgiT-type zinc finger domain-containing protein